MQRAHLRILRAASAHASLRVKPIPHQFPLSLRTMKISAVHLQQSASGNFRSTLSFGVNLATVAPFLRGSGGAISLFAQ